VATYTDPNLHFLCDFEHLSPLPTAMSKEDPLQGTRLAARFGDGIAILPCLAQLAMQEPIMHRAKQALEVLSVDPSAPELAPARAEPERLAAGPAATRSQGMGEGVGEGENRELRDNASPVPLTTGTGEELRPTPELLG
jgi:hypothetical protein